MASEFIKRSVQDLKRRCPLPKLMANIGLGRYAKKSCRSPFREDKNPSFGIYQGTSGDWLFKDHATGDGGDEIKFLAIYHGLDPVANFGELLNKYGNIAGLPISPDVFGGIEKLHEPRENVDISQFHSGKSDEIRRLALSRPYYREGLNWASKRGVLLFGQIRNIPVYVVTDSAGKLAEARRVDGKPFDKGNKSHCIRGSRKSWPIGILEAGPYPHIALVEGVPDFLHAHAGILHEQSNHYASTGVNCAPVAMLGAGCNIAEEALDHFYGKRVTLIPHVDQAGKDAAQRWGDQLYQAGVQDILVFELDGAISEQGEPVNDLYDTYCLSTESLKANPSLGRMFHA